MTRSKRYRQDGAGAAAPLLPALRAALVLAAAAAGLAAIGGAAAADAPGAGEPAAGPSAGATAFAAHCAVCHGPEAAGIPGSFPSLHEQIVAFGKTPEGREYLVMVVTTGLMGELKVGGITYRGVMPAQSTLSEAEVAAVVSYLASDRGKDATVPLTAADVTAIRARHSDRTGTATRALRPAFEP